jgi:hypothetical protein
MKKMRILVVDDTQANIEAAKVAAENFPQHEFVFMTSANEAFKQIEKFDGVITDLFFPEKPCEEMMETYEEMQTNYSTESYAYEQVVGDASHLFPPEKLEKNISIVKNGLKVSMERKPLDQPEFPLGISIMLKAGSFSNAGGHVKKFCLVSDIHCHGSADGQIILLPLIVPLRVDDIKYDGIGGLYYIGSNRISNYLRGIRGKTGKKNPIIWEKAIYCILAQ